jgi:hypothetical protein
MGGCKNGGRELELRDGLLEEKLQEPCYDGE